MDILIFGGLGTDAKQLENALAEALRQTKTAASIGKVSSMRQMVAYGINKTPALMINKKIICEGDIPSVEMIMKALEKEIASKP